MMKIRTDETGLITAMDLSGEMDGIEFDMELPDLTPGTAYAYQEGKIVLRQVEAPPQPHLDRAKAEKIASFNKLCNEAIEASFTSTALGTTNKYPFDKEAQDNMTQTGTLFALDPSKATAPFKTLDAGYKVHSREQFLKLAQDAEVHKYGFILKYNQLKEQVNAAATEGDLDAIQW